MFDNLTVSEIQILDLMAHGYSNHAIAKNLNIAESTAKKHISDIYKQTNNQMDAANNERLVVRIRLILSYLKYIKALKADWEIKN